MNEKRRIINTHDQLVAGGGGVALTSAILPGRSASRCGWAVYRVSASGAELVTDATAAWYQHKRKWFRDGSYGEGGGWREARAASLSAAQAWVAEQGWYSGEWKRNAQGDFVPADVQKRFPIKRSKRVAPPVDEDGTKG